MVVTILREHSNARHLLFLADLADQHRHGANVVRIAPLVFILLLHAAVIASPYVCSQGSREIRSEIFRPGVINATIAAEQDHKSHLCLWKRLRSDIIKGSVPVSRRIRIIV